MSDSALSHAPGTRPHRARPAGSRSGGLETLAAGSADSPQLPVRLAAPRYCGRAGADNDAGACRDRLCGGIGSARHSRPLCDDRSAAGLCAVRSQPHPRAGTRLVARGCHPRRCPAAVWWRPCACRRPCWNDGDRVRERVYSGRPGAPGIRHRAPFQAYPLWIHEWHCPDRPNQPIAQARWVLDRERRSGEKPVGHRHGGTRRPSELDCVPGWRRHSGGDPAAEAQQARARHPDRRGGSNDRCGCDGPGGPRGRGRYSAPSRKACRRSPSR